MKNNQYFAIFGLIVGFGVCLYFIVSEEEAEQLNYTISNAVEVDPKQTLAAKTDAISMVAMKFDVSEVLENVYQKINVNDSYPTFSHRLEAYQIFFPNKTFEMNDVLQAMRQEAAWETVSQEKTQHLLLNEDERNDDREYISFDRFKVETLLPGDTLELPITNLDVALVMEVDTIEQQEGSFTWFGHLTDYPTAEVSITQGEGLAMGAIHFPSEHFAFQVNGEIGWVASSTTLFKPGEVDHIIPGEAHHHDET